MSHTAGERTRLVEEALREVVAHIAPGEGTEGTRSLWIWGELVTCKVPSRKTGGAYSLFEIASQPGHGPPPHVHHREDETFYLLEGAYEFLNGEEILQVGAGSLLYIPKGTLHAHTNASEGVGRLLAIQTPGGSYERFFEEVGLPVDGEAGPNTFVDQTDVGRVVEIASGYGIEMAQRISRPEAKIHARSKARAEKAPPF